MTLKSTESFEGADVVDTDMEYLYSDGEFWHFMHQEYVRAARRPTRPPPVDAAKWLKGEEECIVTLWNGASDLGAARRTSSS